MLYESPPAGADCISQRFLLEAFPRAGTHNPSFIGVGVGLDGVSLSVASTADDNADADADDAAHLRLAGLSLEPPFHLGVGTTTAVLSVRAQLPPPRQARHLASLLAHGGATSASAATAARVRLRGHVWLSVLGVRLVRLSLDRLAGVASTQPQAQAAVQSLPWMPWRLHELRVMQTADASLRLRLSASLEAAQLRGLKLRGDAATALLLAVHAGAAAAPPPLAERAPLMGARIQLEERSVDSGDGGGSPRLLVELTVGATQLDTAAAVLKSASDGMSASLLPPLWLSAVARPVIVVAQGEHDAAPPPTPTTTTGAACADGGGAGSWLASAVEWLPLTRAAAEAWAATTTSADGDGDGDGDGESIAAVVLPSRAVAQAVGAANGLRGACMAARAFVGSTQLHGASANDSASVLRASIGVSLRSVALQSDTVVEVPKTRVISAAAAGTPAAASAGATLELIVGEWRMQGESGEESERAGYRLATQVSLVVPREAAEAVAAARTALNGSRAAQMLVVAPPRAGEGTWQRLLWLASTPSPSQAESATAATVSSSSSRIRTWPGEAAAAAVAEARGRALYECLGSVAEAALSSSLGGAVVRANDHERFEAALTWRVDADPPSGEETPTRGEGLPKPLGLSLRGGVLSEQPQPQPHEQLLLTLEYWRREDGERGCTATAKHRHNAKLHVAAPLTLRLGAASADATDVVSVTAPAAEVQAFEEMVRGAWLPAAPPEFPTNLFWDDDDPRTATVAPQAPPLCWGLRVGTRQAAAQAKTASVLSIFADSVTGPSAHGAPPTTAPGPATATADADAAAAAADDDAATTALPDGVYAAVRREGVLEVGTDAPGEAARLVRAMGAALGAPALFVGSEAVGVTSAALPLLQLPLVAAGGATGGSNADAGASRVGVRIAADALGTATEAAFHEAARPVYGRGIVSGIIFGKVHPGGNLTALQRLLLAQGGVHTALAPHTSTGTGSSSSTAVGRALLGALTVEDSTRSYLRVAATLPACGARCAQLPSMDATVAISLATTKAEAAHDLRGASPVLSLHAQLNRSVIRLTLEVPDSASVERLAQVVLGLGEGGEAEAPAAAERGVTDAPLLGVDATLKLGAEGSMSSSSPSPSPSPSPPLRMRAKLPLSVLDARIGSFKRGESCEAAAGLSLRMRVDLRGTHFAPTMDGSLGCNLALECSARVSNPTTRLTPIASVFELPLYWKLPYALQTGISRDGASRRWEGGEVLVGSMTMAGPAVLPPQSTTLVRARLGMCPPAEPCRDGVASKDGSALDWRPWGGIDRGACCAASRTSLCTRTFGLICDAPPLIGPLALTQGGDAQEMLLRELLRCLTKLSNDLQNLGRSVSYWRAVTEGGRVGFQLGKFVLSMRLRPRFVQPTASVRCTVFHRDGTMAAPERATMSDAIHMLAFDQYSVCLLQC